MIPNQHLFFFVFKKLSLYKSLTLLLRFIQTYLILFDTIVNDIISMIYFFICLSLVYLRAVDIYVLILYSATLLFITWSSFLVELLGYLNIKYHQQIRIL